MFRLFVMCYVVPHPLPTTDIYMLGSAPIPPQAPLLTTDIYMLWSAPIPLHAHPFAIVKIAIDRTAPGLVCMSVTSAAVCAAVALLRNVTQGAVHCGQGSEKLGSLQKNT